jgi:hypothetical protein
MAQIKKAMRRIGLSEHPRLCIAATLLFLAIESACSRVSAAEVFHTLHKCISTLQKRG